jgi:hypothetical protein
MTLGKYLLFRLFNFYRAGAGIVTSKLMTVWQLCEVVQLFGLAYGYDVQSESYLTFVKECLAGSYCDKLNCMVLLPTPATIHDADVFEKENPDAVAIFDVLAYITSGSIYSSRQLSTLRHVWEGCFIDGAFRPCVLASIAKDLQKGLESINKLNVKRFTC